MGKFGRVVSDMRDSVYRMTHSNEKHVNDFVGGNDFSLADAEKDDAAQEAKAKAEPNVQGVDPICKTYYEGPYQVDGQILWVDVPPRQMSKKQAAKLDRIGIKGIYTRRLLFHVVVLTLNSLQSQRSGKAYCQWPIYAQIP
jgi:hypothetical protein